MSELIAISQPLYIQQVAFIENCIRNKFDATTKDEWWVREYLIQQANELGCTHEFINQLKSDNL